MNQKISIVRILILEDNKFILSIIQAALKVYDSQIYLAADQYSAEEMFRDLQPEIVISDLHMDNGTSWDFLETVRSYRTDKVLIVSSDFELLEKVENELGLDGWQYVSKNNRKWLLQIQLAVKIFFSASQTLEEHK